MFHFTHLLLFHSSRFPFVANILITVITNHPPHRQRCRPMGIWDGTTPYKSWRTMRASSSPWKRHQRPRLELCFYLKFFLSCPDVILYFLESASLLKAVNHCFDYWSGMLQGWNKSCFTVGTSNLLELNQHVPRYVSSQIFSLFFSVDVVAVWSMGHGQFSIAIPETRWVRMA